ncbi:hypothetical protein [uncultured Roseobacter sp.]|uniref:hypothetical protein n=1 Tax=uncultured Roseobacter sp. TaxID=114847 RepID=UPI002614B5A6|nr:hypothetical protein [uncultured Roseobacter sp.]
MPDLDSGHIFLTTMAPIKPGAPKDNPQTSYEQRVRIALAKFPTANQSPATVEDRYNSPFARNLRNHLARMFVLNDTIYNGRITQNPLLAQLTGNKQSVPQPVDRLNAPYLIFCADVDAVTEVGDPLPTELSPPQARAVRDAYARTLWETMEEELRDVYSNCYGFDDVNSAEDFASYLNRCHVETTMPFHDYYLELETAKFHNLPLTPLLVGVLAPLAFGLLTLALWLFGFGTVPMLGWPTLPTWILSIGLGIVLAVLAIKFAISNGEKPLAPAKYDDLPSVLKGLYIQQKFSQFFIENQGLPPDQLHAAFGTFVAEHEPDNLHAMTQKPGVISSDDPTNVTLKDASPT